MRLILAALCCVAVHGSQWDLREAAEAHRAGDFKRAAEASRRAVEDAPGDARARSYLAANLYEMGAFEEAEIEWLEAIALSPNDLRFQSNLAAMYVAWGDEAHVKRGAELLQRAAASAEGQMAVELRLNLKVARIAAKVAWVREELLRLSRSEGGGVLKAEDSELWRICTGTGYTHSSELALSQVLREAIAGHDLNPHRPTPNADRALLVSTGLDLLRQCVTAAPNFAAAAHLLADALTWQAGSAEAARDTARADALLEEAKTVLRRSLAVARPPPPPPPPPLLLSQEGPKTLVTLDNEPETADQRLQDVTAATSSQEGPGSIDNEPETAGGQLQDVTAETAVRLHVVTVATEATEELRALHASASALRLTLDVLGMGQEWKGLGQKVFFVSEYLAGKRAEDLVLFVDAYDVILLPEAENLAKIYLENFAPAVVFGAETESSPDVAAQLLYEARGAEPFRFLNSGTYLGGVAAVRYLLAEVSSDILFCHAANKADALDLDDQRYFTRYFIRQQMGGAAAAAAAAAAASLAGGSENENDSPFPAAPRAVLDTEARLFHTLHGVAPSMVAVSRGRSVKSELSRHFPAVLHGNGASTEQFRALSAQLRVGGWPPPLSEAASAKAAAAPQMEEEKEVLQL